MQLTKDQKKRLKELGLEDEFREARKKLYRENLSKAQYEKDVLEHDLLGRIMAEAEGREYKPQNPDAEVVVALPSTPTVQDCMFVYANYGNRDLTEKDAPTSGAWGMLTRAWSDPRFYQSIVDKLTPKSFVADKVEVEDIRALELTGIDKKLRKEFKKFVSDVC